MSKDIKCPYCEYEQDINHDDGYGYEEETYHQQECGKCEKIFVFTTEISFWYDAYKADCLNGGEHIYKPIPTAPTYFTKMRCELCEERRDPTDEERELYDIPKTYIP